MVTELTMTRCSCGNVYRVLEQTQKMTEYGHVEPVWTTFRVCAICRWRQEKAVERARVLALAGQQA